MLKRYRLIVILILIIIFYHTPLFTQNYNIFKYTVKNGLPSSVIYNMTQDVSGKMWFTSNIGVLEFDNLTWKLHKIVKDSDIASNIKCIISDNEGIIYTFNKWLNMGGFFYNNKVWRKIDGPVLQKNIIVTGAAIIKNNKHLAFGFGTYHSGLYIYKTGKWKNILKNDGLLDNDILSIDVFNNEFYVLTSKGISIVSDKLIDNSLNKALPKKGVGLTGIRVSNINNKRVIWLSGSNWIGKYSDGQFERIKILDFLISKDMGDFIDFRKTIIEYDKRGKLFFGNINALYFLDLRNNMVKPLDINNGTTTRGITSLFQDREHIVWTGTKRGLNKIVSMQFENYSRQNGLLENEVTAIAEISKNIMVFGHNNGLTIKNKKNNKHINLNRFIKKNYFGSRVFDILIDSKKMMWVAAGSAGLFLFDTSKDYNFIRHWPPDSNKEYITIAEDKRNKIWLAGKTGIWVLENNILSLAKPAIKKNYYIRKMFVMDDDELFFASTSGVLSLKNNKWERYYSKNKNFNSTYAVMKYNDGSLLIGSTGGLLELKNGKLQLFSQLGWKITTPIYFIIKDKQNDYWVGTKNGVIKFNNKTYKHYTHIDGLVGIEANRGGGYLDSLGNVWIGMDIGTSKYTPNLIDISYPKPLLKISNIKANGNIVKKKEIKLTGNNTIEFFFKGISFIDNRPLKYFYKLIGYDKKWNEKTLRHGYIRYDNLPIGNYSFHLKALNGSAYESDIIIRDQIEVVSPFYLTYWFALIVLFSLLISSILFRKFFKEIRVSKLLKKEIYKKNIQLKESLLSYQSLFEESLDCIFTSTPDGMFLSINKAGLEMFGYNTIKDLSRKNIEKDIYIDSGRRSEFKELMKKEELVKNFESKIKRKNGEILTVIESSYLIKNNKNETIGYRGIIRDITDQHRLQSQLVQSQKMESIGLLAGGIAHDFNNILSGILGYANLLKRSLVDDKKLSKYINTIEKSAERAADLTKKLLGFARKGKYKVTLIDINDIIDEVINLLSPIIDRSIKIERNLLEPSIFIEADASQIQQVIMNICLNARDALPNGGLININLKIVKLSIDKQKTFQLVSKEGNYLNVSIEDNGFGIKEEYLQRIFDPFFTTKTTTKGSGLGLSMVYGVIKNHNGALNVKSIDKKGTVFNLFFPLTKKNKYPLELKSETTDAKNISQLLVGDETVLIVDDEEVHRTLLVNILKERGYTTIEAYDGIEGLKKYSEHKDKIDLVILDMSMPNMGGNIAFKKLRVMNPEIKVLVNSGYSMDDNIQTILDHGKTDFIQKPFKPRHLLLKIRSLLGEFSN